MENVVLVNLSRQMAMRRTMDVIANNLANMNTTAFKAETVLFREHGEALPKADRPHDTVRFVMDYGLTRSFEEGQMVATGNSLDLAISGDGFLTVRTPDGERYTRNGHLGTDTESRLVTHDGHPVLDENGREIFLDRNNGPIAISENGTIRIGGDLEDLEEPVRLMMVRFDTVQALEKVGGSLFKTDQDPLPAEEAKILQGMLEKSNVSAIGEMTRMIETMRAYQSATKSGEKSHEMTSKAIERLGRVQA
ncbi:MAG: flagellar basal-body rod protein FlgF [Alphaproteobacteria bacterium]